jgi:hypothetical protein
MEEKTMNSEAAKAIVRRNGCRDVHETSRPAAVTLRRAFAQVSPDERIDSHNLQALGVCGVDGRLHQRLAETTAA